LNLYNSTILKNFSKNKKNENIFQFNKRFKENNNFQSLNIKVPKIGEGNLHLRKQLKSLKLKVAFFRVLSV